MKSKAIKEKEYIQEQALKFSRKYNFLLLEFATGVGKTLASLKIAKEVGGKWLILCKETAHISEWEKEIKKHKIKIDCEIICYASLHKVEGKYNIICDEAHALTVKRRKLIIKNLQFERIVFLTATLPKAKETHLKILSDSQVRRYTVTMDNAISKGILPHPQINIYIVNMNEKQQKKYDAIDAKIKHASSDYYFYPTAANKRKLDNLSRIRKDIVANFKVPVVAKLVKHLEKKGKRFICFTHSIKQVERLAISDSYIHSKRTPRKKNQEVIENFNSGKSNHLFTVKMLTESANLVGIEDGILLQLDSKKLTFIQRMGRVLRAFFPTIHVFIVKNTMEYDPESEYPDYLTNSLESINREYVKIYGL